MHLGAASLLSLTCHGRSRRDIVPGHLLFLNPGEDGIRRELGAVVGDDHLWLAT